MDYDNCFNDANGEDQCREEPKAHWLANSPWDPLVINYLSVSQAPSTSHNIDPRANDVFADWSNGIRSDCSTVPSGDSGYGSIPPYHVDGDELGGSHLVGLWEQLGARYPADAAAELGGFAFPGQDIRHSSSILTVPDTLGDTTMTSLLPQRCTECNTPVRTRSEMQTHLKRHARPYKCSYPDCSRNSDGFSSNNNLIRHKRTVHGEVGSGRSFVCRHEPCISNTPKVWPRADSFRSHLLRVHKIKMEAGNKLHDYVHQSSLQGLGRTSTQQQELDVQEAEVPEAPVGSQIRSGAGPSGTSPVGDASGGLQVSAESLKAHQRRPTHEVYQPNYQDAPGAQVTNQDIYCSEFASQLFNRLRQRSFEGEATQKVFDRLPDLLKHYALMAGYKSSSQARRSIFRYVYDYRSRIAQLFGELNKQSLSKPLGTEVAGGCPGETSGLFSDSSTHHAASTSEVAADFSDVTMNDEAFEWLLSRIVRETNHGSATEAIMDISREIESHMQSSEFAVASTYHATFTFDCDSEGFWNSQLIDSSMPRKLSRVITITGSSQDAQALTCGQYLSLTWPVTGPQVLRHLDAVFAEKTGTIHLDTLNDGTQLITQINDTELVTEVSGTSASILDVGEQLAWIGAAIQVSPNPQRLAQCVPIMDSHVLSEEPHLPRSTTYLLSFETGDIDDFPPATTVSGRCWHDLFRNPVVVGGYPITPKVRPGSGIEIPLNIMAALIGSQQIDEFEGRNFVKGFSKMLVPAQKEGDVVYWHLYRSEDHDRIPFWHPTKSHAEYISHLQMERSRHVLGWTPDAEFQAGSSRARYEIANSYLDSPGSQSLFHGLSVSQGFPIKGGPSFVICHRDTDIPLIGRVGHIKKLKWMAKQKLLLWDDLEKRGWLVNGLSALLHLVRAYLHNESSSISSSRLLFRPELLHEPKPTKWLPDAAAFVLFNEANLALKVYDEENGTFGDSVDLFYNILEKLIDYQKRVSGDDGGSMTKHPRSILEGWDFHDIMMNHDDRVFPRIATLDPAGRCWVDFIRSLSVVTLFGRGFGDLIKPRGTPCSAWERLPCGKSYIAASLSDLKDLMNTQQHQQTHTRLGRSIWHTETELFDKCSCDDGTCEPVQSIIPQFMSRDTTGRKSSIPMSDTGAVIFGSHTKSSLVWSDFGPPDTGMMNAAFEKSSVLFSDSGIGSSLRSSTKSETTPSVLSGGETQTQQTMTDSFELQRIPSARTHDPTSYTVGIVCALAREFSVVRALLDQTFSSYEAPECTEDDTNIYAFGRMGHHLVVSTCLPAGTYGNNPAAVCAGHMRRSFGNLQFCFLVGVGGGIPSPSADIRLGDVVVSRGVRDLPAVIQYDRGKENDNGIFERTGCLPNPPTRLLGAIAHIQSDPQILSLQSPLEGYMDEIRARMPQSDDAKYRYLGSHLDVLFDSPDPTGTCLPKQRIPREYDGPVIHYGPIASGNKVIKRAEFRDMLARKDGVLCFDMEAAGVAVAFPSQLLVVRGICDYSDAQKNKDWQDYAAANAAAYVKLLLSVVPATTRRPAWDRDEHPRKRRRTES